MRNSAFAIAGAAFLACWLPLAALAAEPVAFVADARGDVSLKGVARLPFLAELAPGATLSLGDGATAAVMYVVSGEEYALAGPGRFTIEAKGVKGAGGAVPVLRVSPVRASSKALVETSKAATASLRMRSAAAPQREASPLRYPVGARIATLQPTLRWEGGEGTACLIVVSDGDGREIHRGAAKGPALHLPVRLKAGGAYAWQCLEAGRLLGEATFQTLPAEAIATAEAARAAARSFADRVALALLLQDLGAAQDAREVWRGLATERPDIPELAALSR